VLFSAQLAQIGRKARPSQVKSGKRGAADGGARRGVGRARLAAGEPGAGKSRRVAQPPRERMTFRLAADVAAALRRLPNQTALVERCVREALARVCPLCQGSGEAPGVHLQISNFKGSALGRLDRTEAAQLKALVRLGRELLATQLQIEARAVGGELGFRLARHQELLLSGRIPRGGPGPELRH
jgi:hypothetical protein